ncbi:MAG: ABC transporter permease [Gammaproteobacteria bacterium]|nr:ABC transporter permease [Gammaproteobacteria bacterium]
MRRSEYRAGLAYVFSTVWIHRFVIGQLSKRAIYTRYRGTMLGFLWSLVTPIVMLTIYTIVFGLVFNARWEDRGGGNLEFAAILFSGMIVHSVFAECLTRAPTLIVGNPQYVKKIRFPLETLAWVNLSTAFFQCVISTAILLGYLVLLGAGVPWVALLAPVPLLTLLPFCLAVGWLLAAFSVYVKDLAQLTALMSTILFFMAPILYPRSALPESLQPLIALNPITYPIEEFRKLILWGDLPNWGGLFFHFFIGMVCAWCALAVFQKIRRGFADVL